MKCVVDFVSSEYSINQIEKMLMDLVDDLRSRGIDILRVSTANMAIDTPHVHITFVNDIQKLRGRKFDEVFSHVQLPHLYLKYPEQPRFEGSLFEYVLEQEGVKL